METRITSIIIDPRSESRKQFGHTQFADLREKLSEQQIKAEKREKTSKHEGK